MAWTAVLDRQFHAPTRGFLTLLKSPWDEYRKYRAKVYENRDLELDAKCEGLEAIWQDPKPSPCLRRHGRNLLDDNPCSG
jgi:hypothetical protein